MMVFFAGVVARVESLPPAHLHCTVHSAVQMSLGDFVRGRISVFEPRESTQQMEGLFETVDVGFQAWHPLLLITWVAIQNTVVTDDATIDFIVKDPS